MQLQDHLFRQQRRHIQSNTFRIERWRLEVLWLVKITLTRATLYASCVHVSTQTFFLTPMKVVSHYTVTVGDWLANGICDGVSRMYQNGCSMVWHERWREGAWLGIKFFKPWTQNKPLFCVAACLKLQNKLFYSCTFESPTVFPQTQPSEILPYFALFRATIEHQQHDCVRSSYVL